MNTKHLFLLISFVIVRGGSPKIKCYHCFDGDGCNYLIPGEYKLCDLYDSCVSAFIISYVDKNGQMYRNCADSLQLHNDTNLEKEDWDLWEHVYCQEKSYGSALEVCEFEHCHSDYCNSRLIDDFRPVTQPTAAAGSTEHLPALVQIVTGETDVKL